MKSLMHVTVALTLYALLWVSWAQEWSWMERIDELAMQQSGAAAESLAWWVTLWSAVSTAFAPALWRVAVIFPVLFELRRRKFHRVAFLALSAWGAGLVSMCAKLLADRERPEEQLAQAAGLSFPSGHALGIFVVVSALLITYYRQLRPRAQTLVVVAGIAVIVLVGYSRVALNVHHLSDVVAGWALGAAWLSACLPLLQPNQRGR